MRKRFGEQGARNKVLGGSEGRNQAHHILAALSARDVLPINLFGAQTPLINSPDQMQSAVNHRRQPSALIAVGDSLHYR